MNNLLNNFSILNECHHNIRVEKKLFNDRDYYHCGGNDYIFFWDGKFSYGGSGDPTVNGVITGEGQELHIQKSGFLGAKRFLIT